MTDVLYPAPCWRLGTGSGIIAGNESAGRVRRMLTDIFADRYAGTTLWESFEERDRRFLVQAFRIASEQLFPYYDHEGKENPESKAKWQTIHDKLSMELGLQELSPWGFTYPTTIMGQKTTSAHLHTPHDICKNFVCAEHVGKVSADRFMKERISFVELAFRERATDLEAENASLEDRIEKTTARDVLGPRRGIRLPGNAVDGLRAWNKQLNDEFRFSVHELNERMRRAGYDLDYHNGFIQVSTDPVGHEQLARPFWDLVSAPKWKNVDLEMKEAIDRRDSGGQDPAFYAAKALESAIKVISDELGVTTGKERGAGAYIENLLKEKSGPLIEAWEAEALRHFFSKVRNPFGHGAGSAEAPRLTPQQAGWAIDNCMAWVKGLVRRLP